MFGMKEVERPAPVLVAALNHVFDGVTNAALLRALVTAAGFAPCSFVFEQSFEYAEGGMERRAPAFGCFAVPAAIFELLAQELISQCVVRFPEIRTDAKDSAVDAGLRFTTKVRPVVEPLKHEPLVDAVDHFASL